MRDLIKLIFMLFMACVVLAIPALYVGFILVAVRAVGF